MRYSRCSATARSGCDFSACSVNVPSGPRKPIRVGGTDHVSQAIGTAHHPLFTERYDRQHDEHRPSNHSITDPHGRSRGAPPLTERQQTMNVTDNDKRSNTRSWYRRAQSGFGKPRVDLMPDAIRRRSAIPSKPVAALLGTIPSLRFVTPAGLHTLADTTQRESVHAGEVDHPPRRAQRRRLLHPRRPVRGVDQPLRRDPISSACCAPATRSASSACSTTCRARRPFAALRRATFCGSPARHFSTRSKPGADRRHNGAVDEAALRQLIDDVRNGTVEPDAAVERLRRLPFAEVGDALVDHHRSPCAKACPRRSTAAARASSNASPSSANC